jgi:hypothetical protein
MKYILFLLLSLSHKIKITTYYYLSILDSRFDSAAIRSSSIGASPSKAATGFTPKRPQAASNKRPALEVIGEFSPRSIMRRKVAAPEKSL